MSTLFPAETPLRPTVARVTNYLLHGKEHFSSDRLVAEKLLNRVPDLRRNLHDNRAFLVRAATSLARLGFDRFADLGCGMPPSPGMLHAIRQIQPQAACILVDRDPYAAAHLRALLATDDRTEVLNIDIRDTHLLLTHARIQEMLAADHHAVVVAGGLLQFLSDREAAHVITSWRRNLPPAGRFVVSNLCSDNTPADQLAAIRHAYRQASATIRVRSREQVRALFNGWTWMEPGLVPAHIWRPESNALRHGSPRSQGAQFYGGVALLTPQPATMA